jgi:hypothetical protein
MDNKIKCPFCSSWGICEEVSVTNEIPCDPKNCPFYQELVDKQG